MVWPEEGDNVALVLALGNFFHLLHGLAITEDVRPTVALLLVAEVVQDALWRRGRETYICGGTAHGDVEDSCAGEDSHGEEFLRFSRSSL
jgi:hypothetical protein